MKPNRVDEIFKKKLERHSLPVSDQAWSQLKSQMKAEKKAKPIIWYVAASVSLLFLLSYGIIVKTGDQTETTIAYQLSISTGDELASVSELPSKPKTATAKLPLNKQVEFSSVNKKASLSDQANTLQAVVGKEESSKLFIPDAIEKVSRKTATIAYVTEPAEIMKFPALQRESEIKVEIYYEEEKLVASSKSPINKSADKLKSLASELSLADLRSAKNQLFASAFQQSRKNSNN